MVSRQVVERLEHLSECCRLSVLDVTTGEGWAADTWILNSSDVHELLNAYRELLAPSYEEQVKTILAEQGIDLDALLIDADHKNDLVTRADICELAAAASLMSTGDWPPGRLALPNIPKMSRRRSESGIDILGTTLRADKSTELLEDELLLLGSVKHTLTNPRALRRDLNHSVNDQELTPVYVAQQLRVYEEKLRLFEPAIKSDRLFLLLDNFPSQKHVRIVAVGVVDPMLFPEMKSELEKLPDVDQDIFTIRVLQVSDLSTLHEQAV